MKIEVKPIESKRWHGKTKQENFKRPIVIQAFVDTDTMRYCTGLDNKEEFKDGLTEEAYYGKLLNQDLSSYYNVDKVHPFWDSTSAQVRLENHSMFFDTEKPSDYVKIKIMKSSKYVANSMKEYEEGLYPLATHVIFDEQEEIELKATKVEMKKKAIIKCEKLSKDRKIQLIMILSGKNLKGKSDNFIEVELDKLIESKAKLVLNLLKEDVKTTTTKALVLEAMAKNIIRTTEGKLTYLELSLGYDVDDAVKFLTNVEQQELFIRIQSELEQR
jgi:hypothetical protein